MIDRSESHLIARERRNRSGASHRDGGHAVRARRTQSDPAPESVRTARSDKQNTNNSADTRSNPSR